MSYRRNLAVVGVLFCGALAASAADPKTEARDALWAAVRGDEKAIPAALDKGADVNAKNEIRRHRPVDRRQQGEDSRSSSCSLDRGADVNARDGIWYQTPLSLSLGGLGGGNAEVVKRLLKAGAKDVDAAAITAAARGNVAVLQAVLDTGKVTQDALDAALFRARPRASKEIREALTKAGAKPLPPAAEKDREAWTALAGTYESDNGTDLTVEVADVGLVGPAASRVPSRPARTRSPPLGNRGRSRSPSSGRATRSRGSSSKRFTAETYYYPAVEAGRRRPTGRRRRTAAGRSPRRRTGRSSAGRTPPASPTASTRRSPGTSRTARTSAGRRRSPASATRARSSGATACSSPPRSSGDPTRRSATGNYGDVDSVNDDSKHTWQVLCLDRDTGKVLWTRTAFEGVPKIKRHLKGSQANCTPATDGKRVVACFGSEGLYCYDFDGKLLWKRDLGTLDSSFAIDQEYEWGFGSSPVIHEDWSSSSAT